MSKENSNKILGSAMLLFALSLLNKGLGFIKSMTIASIFGATLNTDAYNVADGLMQNALVPISEAIAVSFLPIYIGMKERNKEEAKIFTSRTLTDIFLLALVVSGGLYILAPFILRLMLPTYTADEVGLAVYYFRILVWGMCFYMTNSLLQSLLNAEKRYGYSSFTAMMNNLILTGAVLLMGARFGLTAMAAAVLFSYGVQYIFLFARSKDYGHMTLQYGLEDQAAKTLVIQALPIFFGSAICELNTLVDRSLLSGMVEGSVTAVSYAAVLYQFASNMIGIPMNTIIYTELAESFSAKRMEEGREKLENGIHISLFFCIPLSVFVFLMAQLIVQITYGRGAFGPEAVAMTAQGLQFYGLCFLSYCINAVLFRACYCLEDTMLPMKIGIGTVSLNIVLSILLSRFLGLRGIVLATAIANTLTSIITLYIFNRTKLSLHFGRFIVPILKMIVATAAGTAACMSFVHAAGSMNGILVFIVAAMLQFGIYGLVLVVLKDAICMQILDVALHILKIKKD